MDIYKSLSMLEDFESDFDDDVRDPNYISFEDNESSSEDWKRRPGFPVKTNLRLAARVLVRREEREEVRNTTEHQVEEVRQAEEHPLDGTVISAVVDSVVSQVVEADEGGRSRKRKSDPDSGKKNIRKRSHVSGIAHLDSNGKRKASRAPKPSNCTRYRYKCNENFDDAKRDAICKEYWELSDYTRQKDFLLSRVKVYDVQRRRIRRGEERKVQRNNTMSYWFLNDSKEKRVCKKFFLNTLAISHGCIRTALEHIGDGGTFTGEDMRGKNVPANKISEEQAETVKKHITSFPKIESHYTRKDTHRHYLNQSLSIRKMHQLYINQCAEIEPSIKPVSEKKYREIFCQDFNLSFFHPKKDQCATCSRYKSLKEEEKENFRADYEAHLRRKMESQDAKAADKSRASATKKFVSATFDLQSVLQIPSSAVSQMYYSRKICVYNLCIYEAATPNNGFCYCWSELEGRRGSNEIGTCVFRWLTQLPYETKEVSLYSDTCGGQNRNRNVAAMFLYAVQQLPIKAITHNFLESGHSHMECDSMHAAIEAEKKYKDVYTMLDWISIFRGARRRHPYKVNNLHYEDMLDFHSVATMLFRNRLRDEVSLYLHRRV